VPTFPNALLDSKPWAGLSLDAFLEAQAKAVAWACRDFKCATLQPPETFGLPVWAGGRQLRWDEFRAGSVVLETPAGLLLWVRHNDDQLARYRQFTSQGGLTETWSGNDFNVDHVVSLHSATTLYPASRALVKREGSPRQRRRRLAVSGGHAVGARQANARAKPAPGDLGDYLHLVALIPSTLNKKWAAWERSAQRHNRVLDLWLVAKLLGIEPPKRTQTPAEWVSHARKIAGTLAAQVGLVGGPCRTPSALGELAAVLARTDPWSEQSAEDFVVQALVEDALETFVWDQGVQTIFTMPDAIDEASTLATRLNELCSAPAPLLRGGVDVKIEWYATPWSDDSGRIGAEVVLVQIDPALSFPPSRRGACRPWKTVRVAWRRATRRGSESGRPN
jgi:hypothetical protein